MSVRGFWAAACCLASLLATAMGAASEGARAQVPRAAHAEPAAGAASGLRWSGPMQIDRWHYAVATSISCPASSFCVASDYASAVIYHGRSWSRPRLVLSPLNNGNPESSGAVSCASTTFCAFAGSTNGPTSYASFFDGRGWTRPAKISPRAAAVIDVSCASPTFCMAITWDGSVFTYDGHGWSASAVLTTYQVGLAAVSCASASFCVVVGGQGSEWTYDAGSWSPVATIAPAESGLTSVSCTAVSRCVAVTLTGQAVIEDGGGWHAPVRIDPNARLVSVSCAGTTSCLAVDSTGHSVTLSGATWAAPVMFSTGAVSAVSCAPGGTCTAVENTGNTSRARKYAAGKWGRPVLVDRDTGLPLAVSCRAAGYCAVGDGTGNVLTSNAGRWGRPVTIELSGAVSAVSCTSGRKAFCLAGNPGGMSALNGTIWKSAPGLPRSPKGPQILTALSCASTAFCAAITWRGQVSFYNGKAWRQIRQQPDDDWSGISCPASTFCAAVDNLNDDLLTYVSGKWKMSRVINRSFTPMSVSCPAVGSCWAVDGAGYLTRYSRGKWSRPRRIFTHPGDASISCPTIRFCAVAGGRTTILVLKNGAWTARNLDLDTPDSYLTAVSCPTDRYCVALGSDGTLFTGT